MIGQQETIIYHSPHLYNTCQYVLQTQFQARVPLQTVNAALSWPTTRSGTHACIHKMVAHGNQDTLATNVHEVRCAQRLQDHAQAMCHPWRSIVLSSKIARRYAGTGSDAWPSWSATLPGRFAHHMWRCWLPISFKTSLTIVFLGVQYALLTLLFFMGV